MFCKTNKTRKVVRAKTVWRSILLFMNIVWTVCVLTSVVVLTIVEPSKVLDVFVNGCSNAVKYSVDLVAVYCVWLGVFEIAERCNLVNKLAKVLHPVNRWLYGDVSPQAQRYASLNAASNLLGVGNAATPSAIGFIKETQKTETLTRSGAMLFVVNASGIQLVPTTVIALRASFGSANAADIVLPTLLSTVLTAVVGVVFVCIAYPRRNKKS